MNAISILLQCLALLSCSFAGTINLKHLLQHHDQVQPFAQPKPATISEKAAVKYRPQLHVLDGCASFPAVNAAGDITGGLKPTKGTDGCTEAPLGSQMYGRSKWYQDRWAMMFAWYFPKGFITGQPRIRHYWMNMVLWLDNPALETPTILGASLSQRLLKPRRWMGLKLTEEKDPYRKFTTIPPIGFVGTKEIRQNRLTRTRWNFTYEGGSNISTRVFTVIDSKDWLPLTFSYYDGQYHDLIMWDQLTDEARAALNSADFGESKVPFNDENFEALLSLAWPF
ncbi:NPP1-like protein [Phytophthora infestans T30-4]|uniref:NPP1-like protein n=1 Tax=Phytophthora infestans (strain T30-4) TaxID=403677 RepID=D0MX97_PHYIT|nr:NPP1-like protein [Phytophthora infestans T30-4]EEY64260.1 NPP1-like protein [Phytophthora infestans T30-4]|eukprot:XP_002907696.1 NPP1-like protein [Phytophthora infestans T30-4]